MKEEDILILAERMLGPRFNPGKMIAFANAVWGQGYRAGAAAMRKTYTTAPAVKKTAKRVAKRAPSKNIELLKAIEAIEPKKVKK